MGRGINRKPLIDYIRSISDKIDKISDFDTIFDDRINLITIDEWISDYRDRNDYVILDARSESEFSLDSLPNAINCPVLNDKERDEVGFLYTHYSQKAALYLAKEYADKKLDKFNEIANKYKNIVVYCWRGGQRSTALASYLQRYGANTLKIIGGYKAYRNKIYKLFYENAESLDFVVLSGLTGCGKTEIIETMSDRLPIFDIERAASHASSLFGKVRFNNINVKPVQSQVEFENNLYQNIINKRIDLPYLTESESKRINKFQLPTVLFHHLLKAPVIKINTSMDKRVERIVREYFSGDGVKDVRKIVEGSQFIKQKVGAKKIDELLNLIDNVQYEEFSEWFLVNYYDKRYSSKYKNVIAEVSGDNINSACDEIYKIIKNKLF